jgi:hypothetical protein
MKMISRSVAQTSCLWSWRASCLPLLSSRRDARSPHRLAAASPSGGGLEVYITIAFMLVLGFATVNSRAQNEPVLVPDVVDFSKLLPILPDAPPGWSADKPEGSTADAGGFRITNVHRDYRKGEGNKVPSAAISILDSAANPDYVAATTAAWNFKSETAEGYSKSVTIDGNPGFEAYEIEGKHSTLWLMIAKRYFLQIELQNQDPKELQEWLKRVDLKKLAAIK